MLITKLDIAQHHKLFNKMLDSKAKPKRVKVKQTIVNQLKLEL